MPSANDVIIFGSLAVRLGERLLRRRRPLVVQQALDVAGQDRPEAEEPDLVDEIHDHRRLVAGHVGEDNAGGIGPGLEDRPQARVQLGVDQHQVLARVDRPDRDACAELDLAGRLDDGLDAARRRSGAVGSSVITGRWLRTAASSSAAELTWPGASTPASR